MTPTEATEATEPAYYLVVAKSRLKPNKFSICLCLDEAVLQAHSPETAGMDVTVYKCTAMLFYSGSRKPSKKGG